MSYDDIDICKLFLDILGKVDFIEALELISRDIKKRFDNLELRDGCLGDYYQMLINRGLDEDFIKDILLIIKPISECYEEKDFFRRFGIVFIVIINMKNRVESLWKELIVKMRNNSLYTFYLTEIEKNLEKGFSLYDIAVLEVRNYQEKLVEMTKKEGFNAEGRK